MVWSWSCSPPPPVPVSVPMPMPMPMPVERQHRPTGVALPAVLLQKYHLQQQRQQMQQHQHQHQHQQQDGNVDKATATTATATTTTTTTTITTTTATATSSAEPMLQQIEHASQSQLPPPTTAQQDTPTPWTASVPILRLAELQQQLDQAVAAVQRQITWGEDLYYEETVAGSLGCNIFRGWDGYMDARISNSTTGNINSHNNDLPGYSNHYINNSSNNNNFTAGTSGSNQLATDSGGGSIPPASMLTSLSVSSSSSFSRRAGSTTVPPDCRWFSASNTNHGGMTATTMLPKTMSSSRTNNHNSNSNNNNNNKGSTSTTDSTHSMMNHDDDKFYDKLDLFTGTRVTWSVMEQVEREQEQKRQQQQQQAALQQLKEEREQQQQRRQQQQQEQQLEQQQQQERQQDDNQTHRHEHHKDQKGQLELPQMKELEPMTLSKQATNYGEEVNEIQQHQMHLVLQGPSTSEDKAQRQQQEEQRQQVEEQKMNLDQPSYVSLDMEDKRDENHQRRASFMIDLNVAEPQGLSSHGNSREQQRQNESHAVGIQPILQQQQPPQQPGQPLHQNGKKEPTTDQMEDMKPEEPVQENPQQLQIQQRPIPFNERESPASHLVHENESVLSQQHQNKESKTNANAIQKEPVTNLPAIEATKGDASPQNNDKDRTARVEPAAIEVIVATVEDAPPPKKRRGRKPNAALHLAAANSSKPESKATASIKERQGISVTAVNTPKVEKSLVDMPIPRKKSIIKLTSSISFDNDDPREREDSKVGRVKQSKKSKKSSAASGENEAKSRKESLSTKQTWAEQRKKKLKLEKIKKRVDRDSDEDDEEGPDMGDDDDEDDRSGGVSASEGDDEDDDEEEMTISELAALQKATSQLKRNKKGMGRYQHGANKRKRKNA